MVGVLCADRFSLHSVLRAHVYTDDAELFPEEKGYGTTGGALQDVHTITQNDLHTYGAQERTPAFNDKLAKRIALKNMKEVVCDLDSFGTPVYISGDSLLVVSWLQGVWR
eukprot:3583490-Pyramimonas_sp.AAC.1